MHNKKVLIDAIRNLSNPKKTNKNKNYFDISNSQDSDFISAKDGVDTPIYKKVSVKPSPIAGRGLFAEQSIRAGEPIGVSHIRKKFMRGGEEYQAPFPSTTLGYYNHSKEPNVYEVDKGGHIVMVASRDINPGDEITANYDQNEIEDLEGSSDFKRGGSTRKAKIPNRKSPKSYSRSLEATNRLFAQNPLFKKPESRKNKIFDPNAEYYRNGGITLGTSTSYPSGLGVGNLANYVPSQMANLKIPNSFKLRDIKTPLEIGIGTPLGGANSRLNTYQGFEHPDINTSVFQSSQTPEQIINNNKANFNNWQETTKGAPIDFRVKQSFYGIQQDKNNPLRGFASVQGGYHPQTGFNAGAEGGVNLVLSRNGQANRYFSNRGLIPKQTVFVPQLTMGYGIKQKHKGWDQDTLNQYENLLNQDTQNNTTNSFDYLNEEGKKGHLTGSRANFAIRPQFTVESRPTRNPLTLHGTIGANINMAAGNRSNDDSGGVRSQKSLYGEIGARYPVDKMFDKKSKAKSKIQEVQDREQEYERERPVKPVEQKEPEEQTEWIGEHPRWLQDGGEQDGMNGMMKARLAYANEFGNPAAKRMINIPDNPYQFENGDSGTHYMSSMDNYAVPQIQDENGQLMLGDYGPDSREAIRFDSDEDANYFAEHYKDVSPGFMELKLSPEEIEEYAKGGYIVEDYDPSIPELNTYAPGGWPPKGFTKYSKQILRSHYNPISYPIKVAGAKVAGASSVAFRQPSEIVKALLASEGTLPYKGQNTGLIKPGSDYEKTYTEGGRDLVKNYMLGKEQGFNELEYDFANDAGLKDAIDYYGPLKAFELYSRIPHGEKLNIQDFMESAAGFGFNKNRVIDDLMSGYDQNFNLFDNVKNNKLLYELKNDLGSDAGAKYGEIAKDNFKYLFDQYGNETIPFQVNVDPLGTKDLILRGNPVKPLDDIGGHMTFLKKGLNDNYDFTSRDFWSFRPNAYGTRYAQDASAQAKYRNAQVQLMDTFGKPFILHQTNPIDFSGLTIKRNGGLPQAKFGRISKNYKKSPPTNFVSNNFGPSVTPQHSAEIARRIARSNYERQILDAQQQAIVPQANVIATGTLPNISTLPQQPVVNLQDLVTPAIQSKINRVNLHEAGDLLKTLDPSELDKYIDYRPFRISTPTGSLSLFQNTDNLKDNLFHFTAFMNNPREAGLAFNYANKFFPYKNPSILENTSLSLDSFNMLANMGRRPEWDMQFDDMIDMNSLARHSKLFEGLPSVGMMGAGHFDKATGEEMLRRLNAMIAEKGFSEKADWQYTPISGDNLGIHKFMLPNYKITRKHSKGGTLPKAKFGRVSKNYKAPNINFDRPVPIYTPNPIKKTLRDINIETLGTANAVAKGLLPTKVNPMQVLTLGHPIEGVGPFTGSPLNTLPFYGTKLPEDAKNPVAGVAFRKFGDTLDWVKNTGELNPAHGSALRFGKDQISKEGNWSEMGWANEKYPGVFAAGFDSHVPGSNLQINKMDKRNGVVVTEGDNPAISIMDPGVRLHRRLPFSNRYLDINMDKLRNDQFDWRTMGGNAQSLIERYGYTAGYAALLSALGLAAPQDKVDQYINEPIIRSYEEYIEPLINPKEEDGGEVDYELGQEINKATMEKLKKLGYTFQKIK